MDERSPGTLFALLPVIWTVGHLARIGFAL